MNIKYRQGKLRLLRSYANNCGTSDYVSFAPKRDLWGKTLRMRFALILRTPMHQITFINSAAWLRSTEIFNTVFLFHLLSAICESEPLAVTRTLIGRTFDLI